MNKPIRALAVVAAAMAFAAGTAANGNSEKLKRHALPITQAFVLNISREVPNFAGASRAIVRSSPIAASPLS